MDARRGITAPSNRLCRADSKMSRSSFSILIFHCQLQVAASPVGSVRFLLSHIHVTAKVISRL